MTDHVHALVELDCVESFLGSRLCVDLLYLLELSCLSGCRVIETRHDYGVELTLRMLLFQRQKTSLFGSACVP